VGVVPASRRSRLRSRRKSSAALRATDRRDAGPTSDPSQTIVVTGLRAGRRAQARPGAWSGVDNGECLRVGLWPAIGRAAPARRASRPRSQVAT